jgi:hypothetical protein
MSDQPVATDFVVAPAEVWASLAADLKVRAIWLLAQLAFDCVTAQAERSSRKEASDATVPSHPS